PPTDKQQPEPKAEKTPDEATTSPEPPAQRFENKTAYRMPDKNKRNKRPNRQLSAGFSPVGGMSSLNTRDMLYYGHSPDYAVGDPGIGTPPGTGTDASPKEQIVDVKPSIPFSAGITVRRKWNRTLGIETGVVYTRLSSDLVVDREGSRYDAVLILHYVGVPVNLTVNLWEKNRFGLYASGGGMVEKGIRSVFKQKTILFPVRMMNDQVNRIPGLQWSLQGGLGISYRFYREMSFFLEPGISYYFDGKQPVSKRTEDPLNFNLRLGVRYDF
ncbi:MAG: PorT family protein, partial [Tannerella sp.]|nr:PorT family protein [Tannerella sp.]